MPRGSPSSACLARAGVSSAAVCALVPGSAEPARPQPPLRRHSFLWPLLTLPAPWRHRSGCERRGALVGVPSLSSPCDHTQREPDQAGAAETPPGTLLQGPAGVGAMGLESPLCVSRRLRCADKHSPWSRAHQAQTFLSQAGASRSLCFLLHERHSGGLLPGALPGREDPRDLLGTHLSVGMRVKTWTALPPPLSRLRFELGWAQSHTSWGPGRRGGAHPGAPHPPPPDWVTGEAG